MGGTTPKVPRGQSPAIVAHALNAFPIGTSSGMQCHFWVLSQGEGGGGQSSLPMRRFGPPRPHARVSYPGNSTSSQCPEESHSNTSHVPPMNLTLRSLECQSHNDMHVINCSRSGCRALVLG